MRTGSGFLVTGDGDVLTSRDVLAPRGSPATDSIIDVELTGNVHCRARVIGIEPTIDLAVLKIVPPVPVRLVAVGDSDGVQVGYWAIAARPERECYQEHRTSTLLQSSVTIDPVALGGPLVNLRARPSV